MSDLSDLEQRIKIIKKNKEVRRGRKRRRGNREKYRRKFSNGSPMFR